LYVLLLNFSEERRYGIFQEAEILNESRKFQTGISESHFEVLRAMCKAKPITGEQQQQYIPTDT